MIPNRRRSRRMPPAACTRARARLHPLLAFVGLAAVGAAASAGATGAVEAQEVTLQWGFDAGDVREYRQTTTSRMGTQMGAVTQTQTMRLRQEVLEVEADGAADVRTTFLSLRSEMDGPQGRQVYDSEDPDTPGAPGMRLAAGMVGASLDMTVAPDGRVRSVRGAGELMERLLAAIEEESPAQAPQMRAMLDDMFGEEEMRSQMQQGLAMLPEGPVRPGDTWSGSFETRLPFGTLRSDYTYELDDVVTRGDRRVALIDVTGTMDAVDVDPDSPMAGLMSIGSADMTGTLEFDVERGVALGTEMTTVMEMEAMGRAMHVESAYEMELVND